MKALSRRWMLLVWALQLAAPCASDVDHDKASVHAAAHKVPMMIASGTCPPPLRSSCPPPLRSMLSQHAALAERLPQGVDASLAPLLIPTAHAVLSPHAQALAEKNILKIQRSLEQGEVRALERDMSRQAKQVVVRAHCSAALEIVYMSG